ncbi:DUF4192 family protein [Gordonia sp. Z-3]|uniref:DUF4192 family protein n=1 Tax=Gordonia sp. Z-3 TaxID=3115408 RepID=UPI002E29C3C7|nr:DUF4192 family protein [Gordonia sp. Z-3]MED5804002.1 DUF4192 family protein [Gordonia sp. Z-3]
MCGPERNGRPDRSVHAASHSPAATSHTDAHPRSNGHSRRPSAGTYPGPAGPVGIETNYQIVVTRCDQPAPYRDLITGETGISDDYRDSAVSASRAMKGQAIAQNRDDLRARLATTDPASTTEGVELQPELAAKAVVSAMVHWPTEVPRELSAQLAAMIERNVAYRDAFLRTAAHNASAAATVFIELARPLRGRDRANALTLAAACYYLGSDGVMVGVIFDHIAEDTELPSLA